MQNVGCNFVTTQQVPFYYAHEGSVPYMQQEISCRKGFYDHPSPEMEKEIFERGFQLGLKMKKKSSEASVPETYLKQTGFTEPRSSLPVDQRIVPPLKKYNSHNERNVEQLMPKQKVKYIEKRGYAKISYKSKFKNYCPEKLVTEPR